MEESLQKFVVRNVRRTRRELGVGAHGSVEELEADGTIYAGKRIHDALIELEDNLVSRRFVSECQLMSDLRHPHVVQFIGVCLFVGSRFPILVMEYLPENLDHLLETTPQIPLFLKRSILHDVALGLAYLHGCDPPIIHRDLTARNVLLNSDMRAKIADFGVARILDLHPRSRTAMTQAPGNFTYMPPEALCTKPTYDVKIDIFSFGHLALFTITQVFPDLLPPTYISCQEPGRIIGRSETERRMHEVESLHQQLGGQHPFVRLIVACLQNRPELRPSVQQVLEQLELAQSSITDPYSHHTRLQLIQEMKHKETEVADLQKALETKEAELHTQQAKVAHYQRATSQLQNQIMEHSNSMMSKDVEQDGAYGGDVHLDPENKQKSTIKQKVDKYNRRIIEAVQALVQQLRTPKKTGRKSEVDSSDRNAIDDPSSAGRLQPVSEKLKEPPKAEALTWSPDLEVLTWKGRELKVKHSDIAKEKADVIVVCNNQYLVDDGGGVYGDVNRESGGTLEENCSKYISMFGPVKVGHIALTEAGGRLRCNWVIHAVGPDSSYSTDACKALLSQAIGKTLAEAERLEVASIAIPAISSGGFSVSSELTAEAIIDTILGYKFSENSTLLDIRIVIRGRHTYCCFAKRLVLKSAESKTFVK